VRERAANSGFLHLASGLETPISPFWRAKSPKVSGRFLKYSRFQETTAGDLIRTPLPGEGGVTPGINLSISLVRKEQAADPVEFVLIQCPLSGE
jgi:hypothetical protein